MKMARRKKGSCQAKLSRVAIVFQLFAKVEDRKKQRENEWMGDWPK